MDIAIDGVNIFVHEAGSPQGYPLFVLHGGPGLDHAELDHYRSAFERPSSLR